MGINDRLKEAREKAGLKTPADAARRFGWNEHTYKSHENGIRGIRHDVARAYAKAFRVDVGWLITGQASGKIQDDGSVVAVPLVGIAAAGVFREYDYVPSDIVQIPAVPRIGIPASSQYALRVDGESVNKRIPNGMFAICVRYDQIKGGAQNGQLVHVIRERAGLIEHTIKEYRRANGTAWLWPVSDHPDHQEPVEYRASEDGAMVHIQGVVIGRFEPL